MAEVADPQERVGAGWGWLMAYGVVSVALGVAAFIWPFAATFAATVVIGLSFLIAGVVSLAAGVFGGAREGRGYAVAFGIVTIAVGLILVLEPATGALSITVMIVVWLALRGVLELGWAWRHRTLRRWMVVMGLVNLLLALFVLATLNLSALTLPGYLLGISFLLTGAAEISRALFHRRGAPAFAI